MFARLARNVAAMRNALLDLLFPPRCVVCRRAGELFCAACRTSIEKIVPPICQHCGRPLSSSTCPYCAKLPIQIDGTRAVAFFEGTLREAIHAFKYEHRTELADDFGAMLHDYLLTFPLPVDTIIAVPLHSRANARLQPSPAPCPRARRALQFTGVGRCADARPRDAIPNRTRRGGTPPECAQRFCGNRSGAPIARPVN